jgi:dienelactone hydrolase
MTPEQQISFQSGPNLLRGTLGVPQGHAPRGGVVLVPGWTGCRMGPHRILVEAARRLNELGLATLRFDLSGRGESEGDPFATDLDAMIADAQAALLRLRGLLPAAAPLAVLGMCSGGNVGMGALTLEPGVVAAVCWSTYPFQSQRSRRQDVRRTGHFATVYLRKALQPATWARLLRGAVNFRMIGRVLFGHWRPREAVETEPNLQESARDREIVEALGRYRGRVLMIFGGADPEAGDARRIFEDFFRRHGVRAEFDEVAGASHNFYSLQWKRQVIERTAAWLARAMEPG